MSHRAWGKVKPSAAVPRIISPRRARTHSPRRLCGPQRVVVPAATTVTAHLAGCIVTSLAPTFFYNFLNIRPCA